MCTLVILRRPDHEWPVVIGANRDELLARPWRGPDRHWPDRADIVAGQDLEAGGSWLGLNDHGVVAGVLNRPGALGPAPGKRSRGELVLEALDHADAAEAAKALVDIDGRAYRPFNLVLADNRDAFWLRLADRSARVERRSVSDGVSMITANDMNDPRAPRIRAFRPRFEAARAPDPDQDDWTDWQALLGDTSASAKDGPAGAMTIESVAGFGTVSSSLIALPSAGSIGKRAHWLFADGRPDRAAYAPTPALSE